MEHDPATTLEAALMLVTGMAMGLIVAALTGLVGTITPLHHLGMGLGTVGIGVLWYLWKTRENYKDALFGGDSA